MRLLFDANLSPKLVNRLEDLFPGSQHVEEIGLSASDNLIWDFAVDHGLVIVPKDDDFRTKALIAAPPGKVILVTLGNCETSLVELLLRRENALAEEFAASPSGTLLVLP